MRKLDPTCKNVRSRKAIATILEERSPQEIAEAVTLQIPTNSVYCKSVDCKQNPIYMAGRYCKYSRNLSQSEWVVNGVKMTESSVQEIIFEQMARKLW